MTAKVEFYGVAAVSGTIERLSAQHRVTHLVVETATGTVRIILHGETTRAVTPSLSEKTEK